MGRRRSVLSHALAIQRELTRAQNAKLRAQTAAAREAERAHRAWERAQTQQQKEERRLYLESRQADVDSKNAELLRQISELESLLEITLSRDDYLDLKTLKEDPQIPGFDPGSLGVAEVGPSKDQFLPPKLSPFQKLIPGSSTRYEEKTAEAETTYQQALGSYTEREEKRKAALISAQQKHERDVAAIREQVEEQHREVDQLERDFTEAKPQAVVEYFTLVLEASDYPENFPRKVRLAYLPESLQLVVEFELPGVDVVPEVEEFRYVKSSDKVAPKLANQTKRKTLYVAVLAQVTLRTLHELFESDRTGKLEIVVFNGFVDTIDPSTGQKIHPCLITVRATRDTFSSLDLGNVEPISCLKGLKASVSRSPIELLPVKPVIDFDMVDPRFIEESDILSTLDTRPNLMDLSPSEFESLITNLFERMGLDTRPTKPSRDGGVDCVAYDQRSVLGGKIIIQAKRYKNKVGVSAVRDLFGTIHNEGASKGILMTTSGYGKAAFEFANGKPIELLEGTHLLHLLAEHAGIEAKIEVPEGWEDPVGAQTER